MVNKCSTLQVLKVIPYSATQLYAYESFKALLSHKDGSISVWGRLAAGASAGMTATLVSYSQEYLRPVVMPWSKQNSSEN